MTENLMKYLNKLHLTDREGSFLDSGFTIPLIDSNEFAKMYSMLDQDEDLECIEDNLTLDEINTTFVFSNDDVDITLTGDFEKNTYSISFEEKE